MAGADYLRCEECGTRLCYDGDKTIREKLGWRQIFCEKCWIKMKHKILKLHSKKRSAWGEIRMSRRLEDNDMENNAEYNSGFHSMQEFFLMQEHI